MRYVLDTAQALGIGTDIGLVPVLEDPKDLYGLLQPRVVELRAVNKANSVCA